MEGKDIVIFLGRSKMFVYAGEGVLTMEIPPTGVSDLDVISREVLTNSISGFIDQNKLQSGHIYMVLADEICFSKDYPIKDPENTEKVEADIQSFVEAIPFNYVLSKVYKTAATFRVVCANQDVVDAVVDAFTAKGFGLAALVPANIYPKFGSHSELTPELSKAILSDKAATLLSSMIGEGAPVNKDLATSKPKGRPISKRLIILVGVFAALIAILAGLLFLRK